MYSSSKLKISKLLKFLCFVVGLLIFLFFDLHYEELYCDFLISVNLSILYAFKNPKAETVSHWDSRIYEESR